MRIEINAGGLGGVLAVHDYLDDIDTLTHKSNSVIESFATVKKSVCEVTGGLGNLSEAVSMLNDRMQRDEQDRLYLYEVKKESQTFLDLAKEVDRSVEKMLNQSRKQFFAQNPWLRPQSNIEKWVDQILKYLIVLYPSFVMPNVVAIIKSTKSRMDTVSLTAKILSNIWNLPTNFLDEIIGDDSSGSLFHKDLDNIKFDFLGYETKTDNKVTFTKKKNDGKLDPWSLYFEKSAELKGYLVKLYSEERNGILYGKSSVSAITGTAKGETKFTLFNKGDFSPSIALGASVAASVLQLMFEGGVGDEQFGARVKANVDLLYAKAEAGAKFGSLGKDEKGKELYGAEVKAGAMAAIAQVKAKAGFSIFGVDIDVGLSGYLGAAGVEANASLTNKGINAKAGAAAGLGPGVEISIDWSDAKWIDDIGSAVSDFAGTVGKGASKALDDAADFVGDAFDWLF